MNRRFAPRRRAASRLVWWPSCVLAAGCLFACGVTLGSLGCGNGRVGGGEAEDAGVNGGMTDGLAAVVFNTGLLAGDEEGEVIAEAADPSELVGYIDPSQVEESGDGTATSEPGEETGENASSQTSALATVMSNAANYQYSNGCSDRTCLAETEAGDCWAMSDWIWYNLETKKINARIIQYETKYSSRHRTVQYISGGNWRDVPYQEYGVSTMFRATTSRPGLSVVVE